MYHIKFMMFHYSFLFSFGLLKQIYPRLSKVYWRSGTSNKIWTFEEMWTYRAINHKLLTWNAVVNNNPQNLFLFFNFIQKYVIPSVFFYLKVNKVREICSYMIFFYNKTKSSMNKRNKFHSDWLAPSRTSSQLITCLITNHLALFKRNESVFIHFSLAHARFRDEIVIGLHFQN